MFDLIVRGGRVFDGSGVDAQLVDVAIRDGRIAAMAPEITAPAGAIIDARDRIVTPGFIDVHTHFDGQATWDDVLEPTTAHGVTTVMMGNCGVGFAPVRPGREDMLIELMEGVEDIPGAALWEGINWRWETFPQYLDALESRRWSVDVGTQLPHGPLRTYVRDGHADLEDATSDEIAMMARLAREAVEAGAFGFTTSRTLGHKSVDGTPVPGTFAAAVELEAIARAIADGGGRVFEIAPSGLARSDDPEIVAREFDWIGPLAVDSGLATTFILLQCHSAPTRWRDELAAAHVWRERGGEVVPLVAGRPFASLWGWDVRHAFLARPTYRSLAHLPLPERLVELRRPSIRAAILDEADEYADIAEQRQLRYINKVLPECFGLIGVPDYEQPLDRTLAALAEQRSTTLAAVAYDELVRADDAMLFYPLYNYADGDHSVLYDQLSDPITLVGLNDGGAHCAFVCDASIPTYLLSHWARDRTRGPRVPLAEVVRRLTSQPADTYGLADRGRLALGKRADLNVIDPRTVQLDMPRAVRDLPAGGTRLLQPARGFDATVVAGQVTRRHGIDTGARPGRLLRRSR